MNRKCLYFVEGKCEEQLIRSLKVDPARLLPGRVKILNPVLKQISRSQLVTINADTTVVLVYDTDVKLSQRLSQNIKNLKKYCHRVNIVHLAQVFNLEDELVRSTDVSDVKELTKSTGFSSFKNDFCRMNYQQCRHMLQQHQFNIEKMWATQPSEPFQFVKQNGEEVKLLS